MSATQSRGFYHKLTRLTLAEAWMLGEALLLVTLAAPAIRRLSLTTIGRLASRHLGTAIVSEEQQTYVVQMVTWAIDRAAKRSPMRALCFERGLAAQIMLRRRGVDSTLFYGVAPGAVASLDAHVWVLDRGQDVAGAAASAGYAVLASFPTGRESQGGYSA